MKKTSYLHQTTILFLVINILFLGYVTFFITSLPSPLPICIVILALILQLFIYKHNKIKLVLVVLFFLLSTATLFSALDTAAFTNKCAYNPDGTFRTEKEFTDCTATITSLDIFYYGMLL